MEDIQYQLIADGPVKVFRRYAVVTHEEINSAVKKYVRQNAPWRSEQLKIKKLTYSEDLTVPPGRVSFAISTPKHILLY